MEALLASHSQLKYRRDIDGLRAVAVLAVVGFHAFPEWFKGGFIGVDVFFVISGYLITSIIFKDLEAGDFSFSDFYSRRIKRIFPALLVVLLTSFIFGWFALLADEFKQLGKHILAGASFLSNIVLWNESSYFDNSADTKPLLHLWSLGVEEQFYIFWPLIIYIAWKRKFSLIKTITLSIIVSFLLNIVTINQDAVAAFYLPQTRFWELWAGSLIALIESHKANNCYPVFRKFGGLKSKKITNFTSCVGLTLLAYGFWRISKGTNFPGKWALVPVLGATLMISSGSKAWVNRVLLSNKVAVFFGLISFPLYLWHWPLLSFARIVEGEAPSVATRICLVAISVVLSWTTYRFIERHIRFGGIGRHTISILLVFMAFVGYLGHTTYIHEGYEQRNGVKDLINNKNELVRTPERDNDCLKYIGIDNPLFTYCRFTSANSKDTIAVIGDSHAHVAYPGVAEYLTSKRVNTILLANSSCPPFLGVATGNTPAEKKECRERIEQLLDTVLKHKEIKKVFIFTRGPIYTTGTEPVTGTKDLFSGNRIPINEFTKAAQSSVSKLFDSGKSVFYIMENPELSYAAESCVIRPLKKTTKHCSPEKASVLDRQMDYRKAISTLKNVTVLDSLSAFCPEEKCLVFDNDGSLLYADDDHLSIAGSRFQVNKLLKPYLD